MLLVGRFKIFFFHSFHTEWCYSKASRSNWAKCIQPHWKGWWKTNNSGACFSPLLLFQHSLHPQSQPFVPVPVKSKCRLGLSFEAKEFFQWQKIKKGLPGVLFVLPQRLDHHTWDRNKESSCGVSHWVRENSFVWKENLVFSTCHPGTFQIKIRKSLFALSGHGMFPY